MNIFHYLNSILLELRKNSGEGEDNLVGVSFDESMFDCNYLFVRKIKNKEIKLQKNK